MASRYSISTNVPMRSQSLKLGPDGRIYVILDNSPFLSTINNPNVAGAGCNYAPSSISLNPGTKGLWGLPNIVYSIELPEKVIVGDTTLVCNQPVTIEGPTGFSNYLWSTGATTSKVIVTKPGTYWLEVSSGCGVYSDTFLVQQLDSVITFDLKDTLFYCGNSVRIQSPYNSGNTWSTGDNSESITINTTGKYWLQVSNLCGTYTDTFYVDKRDTTHLSFDIHDTLMLCNQSMQITADIDGNYRWSNGATSKSIEISYPDVFWLSVSNDCGRQYSDTFKVIDGGCFYVPSAFSPNGDGRNDVFRCFGNDYARGFHMAVFNRWGERVFQTYSKGDVWDGTYKHARCDVGVYYWQLNYLINNETVSLKGDVSLIR